MVTAHWLGRIDYMSAWDWQKQLVAERVAKPDRADTCLLLEHPPTYTLGSSGKLENILIDEQKLADAGLRVYQVDRGGDITYHGPGQLVSYPIFNLKRLFARRGYDRPDLHRYMRDLEEVMIQALAEFGMRGWRYPGYTGVWVAGPAEPLKIAAIGIRVNGKGISSHGFALNVAPNMTHFEYIVPCGIREHGVVSLADLLDEPVTVTAVLPAIIRAYTQVFDTQVALENSPPAGLLEHEKVERPQI